MITRLPRNHPVWPVIYMVVGAGCVSFIMMVTANDLSDMSEVRNTAGGAVMAGGVGWIVRRMFQT